MEGIFEEDRRMKSIFKGDTGKLVRMWQIILGINPTGEFDDRTEEATKDFQRKHNLEATGYVDRRTWSKGLNDVF